MQGIVASAGWLLAQVSTTPVTVVPATKEAVVSAWPIAIVLFLVFVFPFVVGPLLARWLRLKDLSTNMSVVICATMFGLAPFLYHMMIPGHSWRDAIRLGIDLAGGTNLVYRIDMAQAKADQKVVDRATIEKMCKAIQKRVDPANVEEVTVRRVGTDQIEVIIPGADREVVEQKKSAIKRTGNLEFALLANNRDHAALIERGNALPPNQNNVIANNRVVAGWRDAAPGKEVGRDGAVATREVPRLGPDGKEIKVEQFLVKFDDPTQAVKGEYLTRAVEGRDEYAQLAVNFQLNAAGAARFLRMTTDNRPEASDGFKRRLAILLDGQIQSAPGLNSPISASGQITGNFTRQEINELTTVLNAGALAVPLIPEPVSEFTISPLLGADVQQKGLRAIYVSAAIIFIFMVAYYLVAGVIADLSLILNLILLVGTMALIQATFTLPGLAGLVLTIGMAVDANVLIYERMREEIARGASLRVAIENGFDKALAAIVDSNVTTLITAVVLYFIGTDQIRGFAVSLFIGLTMSLFSALYFGRLCFAIVDRKRLVKRLKMRQFVGVTKVDFLRYRGIAIAGSLAVIILGLGLLGYRGKQNLDIDFTGGTMVTFEFQQPQMVDTVRTRLEEKFGGTITLEQLSLSGEKSAATGGTTRYRMRTTEENQATVREKINSAFPSGDIALRRVTMATEAPTLTPPPVNTNDSEALRFAGGQQMLVKFSSEIAPATVVTYLAEELSKIKGENGHSKYESAFTSLAAKGVATATTLADKATRFEQVNVMAAPDVAAADFEVAMNSVQARLAAEPVFDEINSFDTSVEGDVQRQAIIAVVLSLIAIIIYLWFRFEKLYYGLAAVVAVAHDVLVTLGAIALGAYLSRTPIGPILMLEDYKINMGLIASLLTIVGYSLNDTIVIFDRIREIKGKSPRVTYDMINLAVNETLSRTILTAVTVFLVVLILYIFGGTGLHGFAYALLIGTVTGCYSTIYIANPVLLWLAQREEAASHPVSARLATPATR